MIEEFVCKEINEIVKKAYLFVSKKYFFNCKTLQVEKQKLIQ